MIRAKKAFTRTGVDLMILVCLVTAIDDQMFLHNFRDKDRLMTSVY